jgi:hypothetical protein
MNARVEIKTFLLAPKPRHPMFYWIYQFKCSTGNSNTKVIIFPAQRDPFICYLCRWIGGPAKTKSYKQTILTFLSSYTYLYFPSFPASEEILYFTLILSTSRILLLYQLGLYSSTKHRKRKFFWVIPMKKYCCLPNALLNEWRWIWITISALELCITLARSWLCVNIVVSCSRGKQKEKQMWLLSLTGEIQSLYYVVVSSASKIFLPYIICPIQTPYTCSLTILEG